MRRAKGVTGSMAYDTMLANLVSPVNIHKALPTIVGKRNLLLKSIG